MVEALAKARFSWFCNTCRVYGNLRPNPLLHLSPPNKLHTSSSIHVTPKAHSKSPTITIPMVTSNCYIIFMLIHLTHSMTSLIIYLIIYLYYLSNLLPYKNVKNCINNIIDIYHQIKTHSTTSTRISTTC